MKVIYLPIFKQEKDQPKTMILFSICLKICKKKKKTFIIDDSNSPTGEWTDRILYSRKHATLNDSEFLSLLWFHRLVEGFDSRLKDMWPQKKGRCYKMKENSPFARRSFHIQINTRD